MRSASSIEHARPAILDLPPARTYPRPTDPYCLRHVRADDLRNVGVDHPAIVAGIVRASKCRMRWHKLGGVIVLTELSITLPVRGQIGAGQWVKQSTFCAKSLMTETVRE